MSSFRGLVLAAPLAAFFTFSTCANAAIDTRAAKNQCAEGSTIGCRNFVREQTYSLQKTPMKIFLKNQCELKNYAACVTRAQVLQSEGRYSEALPLLESSCNAGFYDACIDLATNLGRSGQKEAQEKLLKETCDHDSAQACTAYAVFLASANRKSEALKYNELGCSKGHSAACFNLQVSQNEKNKSSNLPAQALECDKGDLFSCVGVASGQPSIETQRTEYRHLCDSHVEVACKLLGLLESELGNEKLAQKSIDEFKKIYWRQCEQGDGNSCFALTGLFSNSDETKRKHYASKTRKIFEKGCHQGDQYQCIELKNEILR